MPASFVARVRVDQLRESAFHCRSSWGDLDGLAASIAQHGVLELVTARRLQRTSVPQAPIAEDEPLELVFGHRRRRGAIQAGLAELDVLVREDLDEAASIALQMVENVQRADLHPLDEGDAYARLVQLGRSVEEIAAEVGRSRSTVYGRIALAGLPKPTRVALAEGRMLTSVGLLIAQLPESVRDAATTKLLTGGTGALGHRVALEIVRQHFTLRLDSAPFPTSAKKLLPTAGPCTQCPKTTRNQAELPFDDDGEMLAHGKEVLCLDAKCFAAKKRAHWAALGAKVEAQGGQVLDAKEAARVMPTYGDRPLAKSGYVSAKEVIPGTGMTFEEAAKKTKDAVPTLAKRANGTPVMLYDAKSAHALARAVGGDLKQGAREDAALDEERAQREAERAEEDAELEAIRARLRQAARQTLDEGPALQALLTSAADYPNLWKIARELHPAVEGRTKEDVHVLQRLSAAEQRELVMLHAIDWMTSDDSLRGIFDKPTAAEPEPEDDGPTSADFAAPPSEPPPASSPKPRARGRKAAS